MVYFVRRLDGLIKIGYSTFVAARVQDLARVHGTIHMLAVIAGGVGVEKGHHAAFGSCRVIGEWFAPSPALLDYIGTLVSVEPLGTVTRRAPDPIHGFMPAPKPRTTSRGRRLGAASRLGSLARTLARG